MKIKYPRLLEVAAQQGCGTAERAKRMGQKQGLKNFDSMNDVRGVVEECKEEDKPKTPTTTQPAPSQDPQTQLNNYVAEIDGKGYTAAEFDFYTTQENKKLDAALQDARDKRLGTQSLALQGLINDANAYAQDSQTSRNTYSEDASTYRTIYQTDALERTDKYRTDMDSYTKINVATIQGEYGLDLAKIQNAGSQAVAAIQGDYQLASDKIRGKTAENVENIRSDYEKYRADRQVDSSVFGGLMQGFW